MPWARTRWYITLLRNKRLTDVFDSTLFVLLPARSHVSTAVPGREYDQQVPVDPHAEPARDSASRCRQRDFAEMGKSEFGKVHPRRDVTGTPDAIRVRIPRWVPQYGAGVGDSGLAETLYSPPVPSEGPCRSLRPCPIHFYE